METNNQRAATTWARYFRSRVSLDRLISGGWCVCLDDEMVSRHALKIEAKDAANLLRRKLRRKA